MLNFLKSLFQTPQFQAGARVNLLDTAYRVAATDPNGVDGRVMTQTAQGVLVEWPRTGARWMNPNSLCQQA
jgi:hypothetical protein